MTNTSEFDSTLWVEFPSTESKHTSASLYLPIEHYCVIADRVFISFLKAYRRLYVEGDDSMAQRVSILGKRLSDFIHVVLPSHPDYTVETIERMNDIDAQLKSYLKRFEENHGCYQDSTEDDECRVCGDEVYSAESKCRDESDPFLNDPPEVWMQSPTETTLLKYVDVHVEDSTDSSSVSSASVAGSFLSNISSVVFEPFNSSIHEKEDPFFEEEPKTDQNDGAVLDTGKVSSIDDDDEASKSGAPSFFDETTSKTILSTDNLESHLESNMGSIDICDKKNGEIDYSFQSLLSHWKLHELKNIKKNSKKIEKN